MSASTVYQGDTWQRAWTLKNKRTNVVINLTGASATVQLRNAKKELVYTATSAGVDIVIDGAAGNVALSVDEAITATWLPGTYSFKFRVHFPDGVVRVYESAPLVVLEY